VDGLDLDLIAEMIQPRLERLDEIGDKLAFLTRMPAFGPELYVHKRSGTDAASALPVLKEAASALAALDDYSVESLKAALTSLVERLAVKNGFVYWPLRIAISGQEVTPGGPAEIACLLGKAETLRRLGESIAALERQG
jgi:glutamyl-tRNA synthetase